LVNFSDPRRSITLAFPSSLGAFMSHADIRLGTLAGFDRGPDYLNQMLVHGFESFALSAWRHLGPINLKENAKAVRHVVEGKAAISAVGVYGNPLQDKQTAKDLAKLIDHAHLYGASVVTGFAGVIEGKPIPQSIPAFKKLWSELAKRAEAAGVKIAWENCAMGGTWDHPLVNMAHSPAAWEMMFDAVPSPAVGLEWEPAHQLHSLVDPLPQLRQWVGKIHHLHGKDANVDWPTIKHFGLHGGKHIIRDRSPGFGDTNWTDIIAILRLNKWTGAIDIEGWHDPVYRDDLETTGQVFSLNYLKQCRGGPFVANPA
jgi:sugar phosphate isomerase/epimerase